MDDALKIFLARSHLRKEVLKRLGVKKQIASFLAQEMKKHREVISRIFLDLQRFGLTKCFNPEAPNFRYYIITKKGKNALKELFK